MVVRVIAAPSVEMPPLPRNRPPEAPQPTPEPVRPVRLPGSKEIAALEVRGNMYTNWTSIRVEAKVTEAFPVFQFECTEETPVPVKIDAAQFVPGDIVRVFLGGMPAVFGYITERHVGYDAQNHGVKLIGCGDTVDLTNSSVPLDKLGNHDGKSVAALARALSEHLGISIFERGNVDSTPFENIQVQPGAVPIQEIERYAKMRNIVIGSEATGGLVLIGEHPANTTGELVEGVHILRANCVVRDNMVYKRIFAIGQNKGGDSASGDPENKQVAERPGTSTRNRHMITVADVADKMHGIERRASMEEVFTEGSEIEAQITVQGWFKDNNQSEQIWMAGEYYVIDSPSLILNGAVLGCAGCVYEQSDAGTTTTLQLMKPVHMNGLFNFRAGNVAYLAKKRAEDIAKAEAARKAREAGT
jgi:prophage tail gpP-like protein